MEAIANIRGVAAMRGMNGGAHEAEKNLHKIVIVGGGADGLELATRPGDLLGRKMRANVTLIDASPSHIWKPLLHEVAAGSLDPRPISPVGNLMGTLTGTAS